MAQYAFTFSILRNSASSLRVTVMMVDNAISKFILSKTENEIVQFAFFFFLLPDSYWFHAWVTSRS